ncbi:MAG: hypothetical protein Q9192_005827 [Flavoplaca navasiana]
MESAPPNGSQDPAKLEFNDASPKKTHGMIEVPTIVRKHPVASDIMSTFRKAWTAHLLNLRFLEQDIDKVDHQLYQAGLELDNSHNVIDRLALKQAKRDGSLKGNMDGITNERLIKRLRCLLKQYDDAIASFNNIMMETFALADHSLQSHRRSDLNDIETFKTRLVRADLARRDGPRDILRHCFRKVLRHIWFFIRQKSSLTHPSEAYDSVAVLEANLKQTYQNTARIAECLTRFVVAILAGAFLVVPLIILSQEPSRGAQLVIVSVCILIFGLLVSLVSKASNEQVMMASAGDEQCPKLDYDFLMASSIEKLPPRLPDDYTVVWLCALPDIELTPALMMLDHQHKKPDQWLNDSDENYYDYGDMKGHNVVIASLAVAQPGKVSAQRLVAPLSSSFPRMKLTLFVGIGGGVPRSPSPPDAIDDVRLGDVVIGCCADPGAPAVVGYDFARFRDKGTVDLLKIMDSPARTLINHLTPFLRNRVAGDRSGFDENLKRLKDEPGYQHPGLENDILFAADYEHIEVQGEKDPRCESCDKSRLLERAARHTTKAILHLGTILSGDLLMMNAQHRDMLSRMYHDAKVFEMEAAAIMADTHCLVVRGVSDYADSHKSPMWKKYAAGMAACFGRELLGEIRPKTIPNLPHGQSPLAPPSNVHNNEGLEAQRDAQLLLKDSQWSRFEENENENVIVKHQKSLYYHASDLWKSCISSPNDNLLSTLQKILDLLKEARGLLKQAGISDPNFHVMICSRLVQAERKITYKCETRERNEHIDLAVAYGKKALEAAKETGQPVVIAQVELEITLTTGREVFLELRDRDDRVLKLARDEAVRQIKAALIKMRSLNQELYQTYKKEAEEHWIRRLGDFGATSSPE